MRHGRSATSFSVDPLSGGWVRGNARAVLVDGRQVIVKPSSFPASGEADGLQALAEWEAPVREAVLGVMGDSRVRERVGPVRGGLTPPAGPS